MILRNKWIYFALAVLVASVSAHESPWLLVFLLPLALHAIYKKHPPVHLLALFLCGIVSFGYISFQLKEIEKPIHLPHVYKWTSDYKINGDALRGFMKDEEGRKVYVTYKLSSEEEKRWFESIALAGRQFYVQGKVVKPTRPHHPYSFQMESYLKSKGAQGIIEITVLQYVDTTFSLSQKINEMRLHLKKHIEKAFPASLAPEAEALLIGLQEEMDDETKRAYQKLGITHLFAISGLHIGILSFLFYEGLLRLHMRRELAAIFLMVCLPLYAILSGGAPSVWRAVAVVELLMLSRLKHRLSMDDALAISFIGFVLLEPGVIYQIGFQLSYLATASLIYSSQFLQSIHSWWKNAFAVTFLCQLIVYPLLLFHFYELSLSSFIANLLYVPLFSFLILPINIALLFLTFIPGPFSDLVFFFYEPFRQLISNITFILESLPYQMWVPGKPSLFLIGIAYFSVLIALYLIDCRAKKKYIALVLLIPALLIHFQDKMNPNLVITFIDVGQGDCILIELPYRQKVYLIDSGGVLRFQQEEWRKGKDYEVGRQIVVPFLKGKGISKIDAFILTHADSDHVEGAEEILKEIRVGEIHVTPSSWSKPVMEDLLDEAKEQKVPIIEKRAGVSWREGQVFFQYLWPMDIEYEGNNDSLVLYLEMGDFQALFTGDLEAEGEQELLTAYPALHDIDLLKAGHHGSRTSSSEAFIQQMKPELTIFCAGENNRFGHPHQEVVERFWKHHLKTMTTGEVGTIEITVNHQQMKVERTNIKK
ncbi:DNA internalization-related competence protein ComEC/Rec2 [Ureibacillus thermophilus]|uniref:DNA internalization-related competence protein ComEC/Rec2 n=1 Tax=Ureibacillus thermophilus TaxID=367743 RepID=UPI0036144F11